MACTESVFGKLELELEHEYTLFIPPPPPQKKKKNSHCFQFLLGITVVSSEIEDNGALSSR